MLDFMELRNATDPRTCCFPSLARHRGRDDSWLLVRHPLAHVSHAPKRRANCALLGGSGATIGVSDDSNVLTSNEMPMRATPESQLSRAAQGCFHE